MIRSAWLLLACFWFDGAGAGSRGESPHAGQETRAIKALAADEVAGYLTGKGMGMAKAAELNGYPGPMHVLELADELELTTAQRERSRAVFESMRTKAKQLGRALVDAERELDEAFARRTIAADALSCLLARVGELQAALRGAHLAAHLEQTELLTSAQIERYAQLRGYDAARPYRPHAPSH